MELLIYCFLLSIYKQNSPFGYINRMTPCKLNSSSKVKSLENHSGLHINPLDKCTQTKPGTRSIGVNTDLDDAIRLGDQLLAKEKLDFFAGSEQLGHRSSRSTVILINYYRHFNPDANSTFPVVFP